MSDFDKEIKENEELEEVTKDKDASVASDGDKSNNSEYEDVCFICRRPESKAGKMFKLPNHICICDDCMHKTMDTVSQFDYQGMLYHPKFQQEMDEMQKKGGFPNISFVNLADLKGDGGIPNKQKLKKKRKRRKESPFWISRIFRLPIRSKPVWMSMW